MKLADRIKPVSFFQAKASKAVKDIVETRNPLILTLNGEGVMIVQDISSYDETQQALAEAIASIKASRNLEHS